MFGIGPMELVVIVVVALLIFGPQRLPEFARTLGKGLAEFRRASNELRQTLALDELQHDLRKTMNQATSPPPVRPAQAGDTLPTGSGSTAPPAPGSPGDTAAGAGATRTPSASPSESVPEAPPWKGHPGELPLDRDHEHHDASSDEGPSLDAADTGLGNVPVTGADRPGPRRG
jgi:TatA/E family protein of Tat protein translocase